MNFSIAPVMLTPSRQRQMIRMDPLELAPL